MERTLYLDLGTDDFKGPSLALLQAEHYKIDEFTMSLESSEDIRKIYEVQINEFLEKNKNLIEKIETSSGKKFRGRIVCKQTIEQGYHSAVTFTVTVLYKKHKHVLKEALKHVGVVAKIEQLDYERSKDYRLPRFFSKEFVKKIYRPKDDLNPDWIPISQQRYDKKKIALYFEKEYHLHSKAVEEKTDFLRIVIDGYEKTRERQLKEQKFTQLPTVEALYKIYKSRIKVSSQKRQETLLLKKLALQTPDKNRIHQLGEEGVTFALNTEDDILNALRTGDDIFACYDLEELLRIHGTEAAFDGLIEEKRDHHK